MIVQILKYLEEGNDFSNRAMQNNLELSEFMAERYKEQLEQRGFIKTADNPACNTSCSSCTSACSFAGGMDSNLKMWEITDKGNKILAKAKEGN